MRTTSTPVISKAQSKTRLNQGKTTQHKNTGVFWEFLPVLVPHFYMLHASVQSKKITGWKLFKESEYIYIVLQY